MKYKFIPISIIFYLIFSCNIPNKNNISNTNPNFSFLFNKLTSQLDTYNEKEIKSTKDYLKTNIQTQRTPSEILEILNLENLNNDLVLRINELFQPFVLTTPNNNCNFLDNTKIYSNNPDIASIDEVTGYIKGLSAGKTSILITNGNQKLSINLEIADSKMDLLKLNKNFDLTQNFAFSTYYKNSGTEIDLLNVYDYKSKKIYTYPNYYLLSWDKSKEKIFVKNRINEVFIMNIDGSEKNKIKANNLIINSISNEGKNIAIYERYCDKENDLLIYKIENNSINKLANISNIYTPSHLTWSSNGNKILFNSNSIPYVQNYKLQNPFNCKICNNNWIIDFDKLTIEGLIINSSDSSFSWSSNVNEILYVETPTSNTLPLQIKILHLDTNEITSYYPKGHNLKYYRKLPQWTPDGNKIFFTGYENYSYDLFVSDKNGENLKNLTNGMKITNVNWINDTNILFTASNGKKLYRLNSETLKQDLVLELLEESNAITDIY